MSNARKPRWQQATALVSLSTCGAMTGFSLAHGTVSHLTSPTNVPVHLLASSKAAKSAASSDNALRAAIVRSAEYYLRLAQSNSPAQMEAMIWQADSLDGVDHGESCAAFASLTLESGAQAVGQQSWVSGGSSYPWPVHTWVDARVDPNPDSLDIISILQDAQAHGRWHPLGDGYIPQPGDWVLFDGHVEVVTKYSDGVLYTIGGDSLPNFSVNAHEYSGSLAADGVAGFVNNGELLSAVSPATGGAVTGGSASQASAPSDSAPADAAGSLAGQDPAKAGQAEIPGMVVPSLGVAMAAQPAGQTTQPTHQEAQPAPQAVQAPGSAPAGTATIPGAQPITGSVISYSSVTSAPRYGRSQAAPTTAPTTDTAAQQAFINEVAPGAMAAQREYGIPAAVTIAQAIDESGWGQSKLAVEDHNLFGIKGTGPAGSVTMPTQEYVNGQTVTIDAPFRVYSNITQSITDHSLLLATGSSYQQAMADRRSPDAFANDLTGVYATDPNYGASLITIMRQYNLYRFDADGSAPSGASGASSAGQSGSAQGGSGQGGKARGGSAPSGTGTSGSTRSRVGTESGTRQTAVIPGVGKFNAAALGMATHPAAGGASSAHGTVGIAATPAGGASIPGALDAYAGTAAVTSPAKATTSAHLEPNGGTAVRAGPRNVRISTRRYAAQMPRIVTTDFITHAKTPLLRAKPLYQDVAANTGVRWELLAACDWMQCQAQPRVSPVHGEKLGSKNADGTVYRTKSEALEQCAADLIDLSSAVYGLDLTQRLILSVRELASVFGAFRWGGLLRAHRISAMEFPYSVAGLTGQHLNMRWPEIGEPAPDKPGTRFRKPFGAVPVVLSLDYPAVA
jgi:flagellum-specific peptidoglycan hydrolase FlgJ